MKIISKKEINTDLHPNTSIQESMGKEPPQFCIISSIHQVCDQEYQINLPSINCYMFSQEIRMSCEMIQCLQEPQDGHLISMIKAKLIKIMCRITLQYIGIFTNETTSNLEKTVTKSRTSF